MVVGVVVLAVAWTGWTAYQVNRDLNAAVADAETLRDALEAGDDPAMKTALDDLADHSGSAADRTDGVTWSALTHLPGWGDDARGVALVSSVASDLAEDGVGPLIQVSDELDSIVPGDARVDVAAVARLVGPVATGRAAFAHAAAELSAEDPTTYDERLRSKYRELAEQVDDAAEVLGNAETALEVLPTMLGQDGPRNYLLVFQNNAEIRATGGLPGAVSVVRVDGGKVEMTRQVAANTFGRTDAPVLPLTPAERETYTSILGTFFLDANLQPDFPRAAELWQARWQQVYPERIDGVLSLDPVALSYVLGATGSVSVGGVTLTEDNAVDELLHQVYLRLPDPDDQDQWFREVARTVFDRVSQGVEAPQDLINALARGVDEHRIYVHDFDPSVDAALSGTAVAGELVTDPKAAPQVGVYVNDGTGAKMSYYLRYDVDVAATYCTDGVQGLTAHATFMSEAPEDSSSLPRYLTGGGLFGTKPGDQYILVHLYGPVGGTIRGLTLNGQPQQGTANVVDQGREVATVPLLLEPQQKVDLTWRMRSGPGQDGDPEVSVTPSVVSGSSSSVVSSEC